MPKSDSASISTAGIAWTLSLVRGPMPDSNFVGRLVWAKSYASRAGFLQTRHEQVYLLAKGHPQKPHALLPDVQRWECRCNASHPTQKAVSVLRSPVESFCPVGGVVFDLFAGSGSTLVAAAQRSRLCRNRAGGELCPPRAAQASSASKGSPLRRPTIVAHPTGSCFSHTAGSGDEASSSFSRLNTSSAGIPGRGSSAAV